MGRGKEGREKERKKERGKGRKRKEGMNRAKRVVPKRV